MNGETNGGEKCRLRSSIHVRRPGRRKNNIPVGFLSQFIRSEFAKLEDKSTGFEGVLDSGTEAQPGFKFELDCASAKGPGAPGRIHEAIRQPPPYFATIAEPRGPRLGRASEESRRFSAHATCRRALPRPTLTSE